ncbi:MAG: IS630 family transposase [Acidobacteriota bacterium]
MRPHGSPEQLERRRRRALGLLRKGLSLSAVAAKIGCSPSSVVLWREAYRKQGERGLRAKPAPGRPSKLDRRQKQALSRLLLRGALSCGYRTDLWTTRRVAELIEKRFGVDYHPNHLWRLLQALGWSCQRPATRAGERDDEAIAHRKRSRWPHIKKRRKAWRPSGVPR